MRMQASLMLTMRMQASIMRSKAVHWAILLLVLASAALSVSGNSAGELLAAAPSADPAAKPAAEQAVKKFKLYATDGYTTMPDGEKIYIWGYSLNNKQGSAVYPAPTLTVNEGDRVEVTVENIGPSVKGIKRVAHTVHFHGLDTDQENDGVPHTSHAIQPGQSFTYRFKATHAGTYWYHCHVDTVEHLQMGMHGAFIVKAKDGAKEAWTGGPTYDREYTLQLNELDPVWHKAVEQGRPYDKTDFRPVYFTINGKAYPDTERDPNTMLRAKVGEKVLIRLINAGYQAHSIHTHGHHFQVIASDGRPLPKPYEKDTILIGPGERYDLLMTVTQAGHFPIHSHHIIDNTNNGVYPGGMHTMMEVAPEGEEEAAAAHTPAHNHHHAGNGNAGNGAAGSGTTVHIQSNVYSPKELTIAAGTKMTWINKDKEPHTITDLDGRFDSGDVMAGASWSYTFEDRGEYTYYCSIHPAMEAKVIVK